MPCNTKMKKGKGKKKGYRWLLLLLLLAVVPVHAQDLDAANRLPGTYPFVHYLTLGGGGGTGAEAAGIVANGTRVYGWGPASGTMGFVTKVHVLVVDALGVPLPTTLGTSAIVAASPNLRLVVANTLVTTASNVASASTTIATTNWNTFRGDIVMEITSASPSTTWNGTATLHTQMPGIGTNKDLLKFGFVPTVIQSATTQVYSAVWTKDFTGVANRRPMAGAQELPLLSGLRLRGDDAPGLVTDSDSKGEALCLVWPPSLPHELFTNFQVVVEGYYFVSTAD